MTTCNIFVLFLLSNVVSLTSSKTNIIYIIQCQGSLIQCQGSFIKHMKQLWIRSRKTPHLSQGDKRKKPPDVPFARVKLTTIYKRFTRITTLHRVRQVPGTTDHRTAPGKTLIVPTTKEKPFYSANRNV